MKRLTLVVHKDDERRIIEALQPLSAVEIIAQANEGVHASDVESAQARVQKIGNAIGLLKPFSKKKGLLTPADEVTVAEIDMKIDPETEKSEEIEQIDRRLSEINTEIEKNNSSIEILHPWCNLDAPIESLQNSDRITYFCGTVNKNDIIFFQEVPFETEYQVVNELNDICYIVAASLSENAKALQALLKEHGWSDCTFPKFRGKPAEIISALRKRNEELSVSAETLHQALEEKGAQIEDLQHAFDAASIRRDREEAINSLGESEYVCHLEGWIRSDKIDEVESAVKSVTDAYCFTVTEPDEDEVPPAVLKNSKIVTPFEGVNNLYSLPDPVNGIDGTPYMTPFYIFLFGMMLSDAGYGLVLMVGAWLFNKLAKPRGMVGDIAKVLIWGGFSTVVWGVLVGTFFGVDFDLIFGTNNVFPLFMDPMSQPIPYLLFCFGLGVIHILFGVILKMKMALSVGDWQTAVFDNLSWVMIILGLIVYAGGSIAGILPAIAGTAGLLLAGIGAVMILVFKGRAKKNIALRVVSGLGELYQVTSYLSDILSYARLFALGIATGVIAEVFNDLCGMLMGSGNIVLAVLGTVIAVALLVFLHVFNIAINTLGTFVHCARLQYVEFYGKFFEAGGRAFKPLSYKTKHVRITNQQQ